MKKALRPSLPYLPATVRFKPLLAIILGLFFNYTAVPAQAQKQPAPDLQAFAGTYHLLGKQHLALVIIAPGNRLLLKEPWSNREINFNQKAELQFVAAANPNFTLDFARDKSGAIDQVTAFKKDGWVKAQPAAHLSPAEAAARARAYKSIFSQFAEAVNANTTEKIRSFITANVAESVLAATPMDNLVKQVKDVYRQTGGLEMYTAMPGDYENGTVIFKGRSLGNLCQISFTLSPENKIAGYNYRDLREYAPGQKPATEAALRETIAQALTDLAQKDQFSGTVLVAKGDKVIFEFAAGEANKKTQAKNTLDTRFNLGSMNKMFTATAMLQLAEKGKLTLQDAIGKYLDTTWLPRAISEKVTVHHLFSHTSGIRDVFWELFPKAPRAQFWQLAGYKPFTKTFTLATEPDATWAYNNAAMLLAGIVIEQVAGMNYFDYVRQHIYGPAGMRHTGVFEIDDHPEKVAIGYVPQANGSYQDNINTPFTLGSPAGGGYSTTPDLHKFALALQSGKLVSAASRDQLFTDYRGRQYGYGFEVRQTSAGKVLGHGGGAFGLNAVEYILPVKGYVIVVMANYDRAAQLVGEYILAQVLALP